MTGWQWRGDLLSIRKIPPVIELHFRFWDPDSERAFWRRASKNFGDDGSCRTGFPVFPSRRPVGLCKRSIFSGISSAVAYM